MDRLHMPGAMPAELAERLSDRGSEYTVAERREIDAEVEKRIVAKLEAPAFWTESLEGISETDRVARLLAFITGSRLDRAYEDPLGAAAEEIATALARFQRDTRSALRDGITDEVEGEYDNGGIES